MARSYNYAVLRLAPDPARGEAVNLGILVFRDEDVDVRLGEVMTRARALYPEVNADQLHEGVELFRRFGAVKLSVSDRHRTLSRLGLFALGELGYFTVDNDTSTVYEQNVARLVRLFTVAPRSVKTRRRAISPLGTTIRKLFRQEKVLASIGDAAAINEHKIVPEWPLPTRPSLQADLALRNTIMRVCEVVELPLGDEGMPPSAFFEGIVTLDVARREANATETVLAYRAVGPSARIDEALGIANPQNRLVDWDDVIQRDEFLHEWIAAARTHSHQQQPG